MDKKGDWSDSVQPSVIYGVELKYKLKYQIYLENFVNVMTHLNLNLNLFEGTTETMSTISTYPFIWKIYGAMDCTDFQKKNNNNKIPYF